MKHGFSIALAILAAGFFPAAGAFETEPVQKPGVKLRFVTEENALVPGKPITVGLFMEHEELYHTYWKSPGIVGVATMLDWKLPAGFEAGPIQWPAPQRTKMAQVTAYGYETDTCLLSRIHVPDKVEGESVTLKVRIGLMCCAASCHPSWHDFEFTLPVLRDGSKPGKDQKWAKVFKDSRARFPRAAPESWKFTARNLGPDGDKEISNLRVDLSLPDSVQLPEDFDWDEVYFFCHDNQVNSDEKQEVTGSGNSCSILLRGTDFGPKDPKSIDGVLFHPPGMARTGHEVDRGFHSVGIRPEIMSRKKKKKVRIRIEPSNSEWCEIRDSPIHGRGLYATKPIPNETYIIEYMGERIDKEESNRRGWERIDQAKETGEAAVYIFALNDEFDIDGSGPENHARLINHSCDPNCEAYVCDGEDGKPPTIWVCAIRDIKKGEELFFNYGFDLDCYEDHPCRCGAKICVGYIAGEDFWDELKEKLARKEARKRRKKKKKKAREKAKA